MHSVSKVKSYLTPEKVLIQIIVKSDTADGKGSNFFWRAKGFTKISKFKVNIYLLTYFISTNQGTFPALKYGSRSDTPSPDAL